MEISDTLSVSANHVPSFALLSIKVYLAAPPYGASPVGTLAMCNANTTAAVAATVASSVAALIIGGGQTCCVAPNCCRSSDMYEYRGVG